MANCSNTQLRGETMMRLAILVLAALAAGCATSPGGADFKAQFDASIPVCSGDAECTAAWEAAQIWVAKNSRLKIQTATNVMIETFGGGQYDPTLAMRVLKEPQGVGRYSITFSGWCHNMFGCSPNQYSSGVEFNHAISAAISAASAEPDAPAP